jgi:hypothetical protein
VSKPAKSGCAFLFHFISQINTLVGKYPVRPSFTQYNNTIFQKSIYKYLKIFKKICESISTRVPQNRLARTIWGMFGIAPEKKIKNMYRKDALSSRVSQSASGYMHFNRGDHPMWEK